VKLTQYQSK